MFICFCKQQLLLAKINHVTFFRYKKKKITIAACKKKKRSNYKSKDSIVHYISVCNARKKNQVYLFNGRKNKNGSRQV